MDTLARLKENKIVAIIRSANRNNILHIVDTLQKGGVKAVEITAETPKVNQLIEMVVEEFGSEVLPGAGTVLDPETARSTILAGAKFIVSPTLNIDVIRLCNRYGIVSVPGAFTPTEMLAACENGADLVKVFPAGTLGLNYIKNVLGPLPHLPIMATGGITLENVDDYLAIGCQAVGVGSDLVNANRLRDKQDYQNLVEKARKYVDKVNERGKN